MGTVIGGLLLPRFDSGDYGQAMNRGILGGSQIVQGQTALLALQEEKQKQAAQERLMLAIQNDPDLRQRLFGDSIIGSLPTTGAPPGAGPGPITQSPLGGGPAQQIPAYPDASRFANVPPQGGGPIPPNVMAQTMPQVTPPQSVLGSLGPAGGMPQGQPQGPMPGPQNALLEMARKDPRAAMMLQKQIEGQQDAAITRQMNQLKIGSATLGYVGQQAQGVTDQAGLDAMRSDLQSQGLGKYAAQLPQLYSKEAMQPFIAKALDVKESLTLQIGEMKARADQIKAGLAGRTDAVNTELEIMGLAPASVSARAQQGDPQARAQLADATTKAEQRQVRVSASQGTGQIVKGPTGEYIRVTPGTNQAEVIQAPGGGPLREKASETEQKGATLANSVAAANTLATDLEDKGYKPSVWDKGLDKLPLGLGNYLTSSDYQQYRQTVREFASAYLYGVSGAQINESEWENANQTFFPQPNEDKAAVALKRQRRAALVEQLRQQSGATGRTGSQPQGQGSTGSAKPVGQMSKEDLLAEKQAILARGGH